jgi:hypothetical protein
VRSSRRTRGEADAGWFALGVLLGPFGLILAFVVEPDRKRIDAAALQSGAVKKCPFCAELVKSEAKVCRFCGRDLPLLEKKASTVRPGDEIYYSEGWFIRPASGSPIGPFPTKEEAETAERGEPRTSAT